MSPGILHRLHVQAVRKRRADQLSNRAAADRRKSTASMARRGAEQLTQRRPGLSCPPAQHLPPHRCHGGDDRPPRRDRNTPRRPD